MKKKIRMSRTEHTELTPKRKKGRAHPNIPPYCTYCILRAAVGPPTLAPALTTWLFSCSSQFFSLNISSWLYSLFNIPPYLYLEQLLDCRPWHWR